ncbi:MAG: MBOAT family protein [Oscillospiraceae bacterium]|nr:MBOAT family protein [Oscillospiraceae bacterium]
MVFSSLIFLYGLFSLSLLAYALCRTQRAQNMVLLVFSLVFYTWGEPKYVLLLMFMALASWFCALGVDRAKDTGRKKFWVILATVIDISLIGYFKYAGFICGIFGDVPDFIRNIALPIGISFYTFQLLTYVIDVYRGDAQVQKSYWNVLLYAALFHQCVAGPIVRYKTIDQELFSGQPRNCEWTLGIHRFTTGLAKKVLLANPCGALAEAMILADSVAADSTMLAANVEVLESVPVLGVWLGVAAYTLHIYLDFSAYSDMAIGMGRMLGLHYLENFNYPYITRTVTEFWRRWHMSLSTFFRDYVYIPLGGSRCSLPRAVFNTFVVWALTGLWHGASWNFVVWGLYFFVFLMLERFAIKRWLERVPVISNIYLLVVVMISWVIFRFTKIELAFTVIKGMFGLNGNPLTSFASEIQLKSNMFLLVVAVVASTPFAKKLHEGLEDFVDTHKGLSGVWNVVVYSVIPVIFLLLSTACLVGDSYNPFIYFQF